MSTFNSNGNYPLHNKDTEPTTATAKNLTLNLTKSPTKLHTDPESKQPGIPVQYPPPSFDVAHRGWDASNVATAKCDLCHRHRCGTLQKCRVCKLSICRECCVDGRLRNDRRHAIDAGAVEWNAPPNLRKRKLQAGEAEEVMFQGPKRQKASGRRGRGQGRGYEREVVDEDKGSYVVVSDEATQVSDDEVYGQDAARFQGYGPAYPMEPRLSVAPASHYPFVSRVQNMDVISPKYTLHRELETTSPGYRRLPASEEVRNNGDDDEEYGTFFRGESYHAASNPGLSSRRAISSVNDFSQAAPSGPVLPPINLLHRDRYMQHHHQPNETFRTSSDILSRLEHLIYHHHQQQLPLTSESWPPHEHTESLGTALADAARASHRASSPPKPLDHCLRDELQAVWTSRAFVIQDPDAGHRYRQLLAAAYFASARLGLEPRGSAAREWLCAEERKLREMGCEPTRTAQLMDFIQEVGIWYLRQAQF